MLRYFFCAILVAIPLFSANSQKKTPAVPTQEEWVEKLYNSLTPEERIAQLFMIAAYSNGNEQHVADIEKLIREKKIGGLIFMQGGPGRQAHLTNRYQQASRVPLMIGMDLEWGLSMRLDSTMGFPRQMALGAVQDDSLITAMGEEIARQMKLIGVHINFAPVADVNNNPNNPVIGTRSFGENKFIVASRTLAYMKGMQSRGVMAVAKHFPGHGDTDKDSHETLPVISHKKERIDDIESYPFRKLIQADIGGIMTAHLQVNDLDRNYPSSLSEKITTGYLRDELGFDSLVFTDALNMKAIADRYADGEAELLAFRAGSDVLLFSQNIDRGIERILEAVEKDDKLALQLERTVKRILRTKYQFGLHKSPRINPDNLDLRLNTPHAFALATELEEKSITVLRNRDDFLPVRQLDNQTFASVNFGDAGNFTSYLNRYTSFTSIDGSLPTDDLLNKLSTYNVVIAGIFPGQSEEALNEINKILNTIGKKSRVITCYFGNPYELEPLADLPGLLVAYSNSDNARLGVAQGIFGAIPLDAKLPVSVSVKLPAGTGLNTSSLNRLGYGIADAQGISSRTLEKIDELAREAVSIGATPGCQVLVAKGGKVVYSKNFGYYTYDSIKPVDENTIYDLASVTKVLASTQALMFLEERGLIDLDKKISVYLPELKGTNKENMILRDILTHQAGLWAYLPFYAQTMKDKEFLPDYYAPSATPVYSMKIADGLYAKPLVKDSVWHWVVESRLRPRKDHEPFDYKYSDMGYYMMQRMIERILNQSIADFMQQNFYDPMGMSSTGYKPLDRFPRDRIAPTEQDNFFRKSLITGMVHDQGAALFGGVAGHAGLFGTANDLAKNLQMLLNGGNYGGVRYLQRETVMNFTDQQYANNRRGLGWDKPLPGEWYGPTTEYASKQTFGHTGFTGTAIWVDPEFDLIYVFLANRIYPDAGNSKLLSKNIRTRIQEVIYQAIWDFRSTQEAY
ncbi:glycoside hydrolase family 3 N-terminal domain-containing protein [Fulvivirga sedimenti]|uniref:beta-N-acetylhexosaminidase n=1 Tax=Fulvivirga sedimenti TaxID=2879465 RepID=A0A9X1HTA9_9BACT|nr:glycoside hydrolase family 3 N-terminal domain-containing protein [Fulvivirga sedimenti]MCA6075573.1 serine hydrolase [Fulvivirga sedimenti]MCA6076750.1 serine hydrolase [Fulvivirga sedimenti]MCA6077878.1 serine hydrolase [Fulvivirga sedimenti]